MLPKTEEEARKIAQSTILISFLLFLPITVVANTAGHETLTYLGLYEVALFATLIPLHSLFTVWIQVNQQLLYRNRKFGLSARLSIVHELILNLSKSALGLISPTATILLGSQITSSFLYVALTTKKEFLKGGRLKNPRKKLLKDCITLLSKYKDFPLYRAPEATISAATLSMPLVLLTSLYGANAAGFYAISKMVLKIPNNLLVNSIGNVLYPEYSKAQNSRIPVSPLAIKATIVLSIIGFAPYFLIFIYGAEIFAFIFGGDWIKAGEMASWLSIWMYSALCTAAAVKLIPIIKINKDFLIYRIAFIIISACSLLTGFMLFNSDIVSIAMLSITSTLMCVGLIIYTISIAKLKDRANRPKDN